MSGGGGGVDGDDLRRVGDDLRRVGDDLRRVGDDLRRVGDDLRRVGDDLWRVGDERASTTRAPCRPFPHRSNPSTTRAARPPMSGGGGGVDGDDLRRVGDERASTTRGPMPSVPPPVQPLTARAARPPMSGGGGGVDGDDFVILFRAVHPASFPRDFIPLGATPLAEILTFFHIRVTHVSALCHDDDDDAWTLPLILDSVGPEILKISY
ncbi:hypothetical protein BC826DRAFT_1111399 [Russula brevipes]|nr:hypothetical protein BC826DRAFT_1111399 [Russula brevipes]